MYLFRTLGFSVDILDIANTSEVIIKEKIKQTPCLYISGGNTFYLLQELKKKNLLDLINLRISEGMVYIGESAGAMIMLVILNTVKLWMIRWLLQH